MTFSLDDNCSLEEMANRLLACDNFVICGHVSPDGDCVGSQLALMAALKLLGKTVTCINASKEPIPYSLRFLPGSHEIIYEPDASVPCDVFVAVDVSEENRFGNGDFYFKEASTTFILDHHSCKERIADYSYVDPDSPSASMIVWKFIKLLCAVPPTDSAICAYTGLMTDTGGFRFQNTTGEAFQVAAELVAYGAQPSTIATQVFQNQSLASLLLEQIFLTNMQVFHDGEGVISFVSSEDVSVCGAEKGDTDSLIDIIRALRGVRVACMLREEDGFIKGSLRAKDQTDVAYLASQHNGGGHKAAAGFKLFMPLNEAVPFMCDQISLLLSKSEF